MLNESFLSNDTQSQSILANNTQIQMPIPHMQQIPFGQSMMGFQPNIQQLQHQSVQQPYCPLPDFEIDQIAARLKDTFFADLDKVIGQKVIEQTANLTQEIKDLRMELNNTRASINKIANRRPHSKMS